MQIVYVAGPYRAKHPYQIQQNIQAAWLTGAKIVELGLMPLVPHLNCCHMEGLQDDKYFLEGTLELLRRSDAVLLVDGWRRSEGARGEKAEAERLGIPVFEHLAQLLQWLISLEEDERNKEK